MLERYFTILWLQLLQCQNLAPQDGETSFQHLEYKSTGATNVETISHHFVVAASAAPKFGSSHHKIFNSVDTYVLYILNHVQ